MFRTYPQPNRGPLNQTRRLRRVWVATVAGLSCAASIACSSSEGNGAAGAGTTTDTGVTPIPGAPGLTATVPGATTTQPTVGATAVDPANPQPSVTSTASETPTASTTAVAATPTAGSSTTTAVDATSSTTVNPMPSTPDPTAVEDLALIDDFEDGDALIKAVEGRSGQWTAYNDGSAGATQTPAASSAAGPTTGGALGSSMAMHTAGSGFTDWGAGVQLDFNNTGSGASSRKPFDASAYSGVSFYAKGQGPVRIELSTPSTTDSAGGGTCTTGCFDTHGVPITLSADWAFHTVVFSQFEQEGWGSVAPFDPSALLGLAFKVPGSAESPAEFDFWIDDVRFLSAEEANTPDVPATPNVPVTPNLPVTPVTPEPVSMAPTSVAGQCSDAGGYNGNGSLTYYYFDQGSAEVNCSYQITGRNPDKVAHVATGDGQYFGAMNTADYNNAAMCGACVEITRDGNRKVVVTIVDQCPVATNSKCQKGHIDVSVAAFDQLGDRGGEGYLGTGNGGTAGSISWKYVECPLQENVSFRLKEPDNAAWNQVLVQGHKYPIQSVDIGGQPATRQPYNYWEPPGGNMGAAPYEIKVTDIHGGVITAFIDRSAGDIDSGVQLSCQ